MLHGLDLLVRVLVAPVRVARMPLVDVDELSEPMPQLQSGRNVF